MVGTYAERLLEWYHQNHRKLPWRETKDPYRIWVSEIMLQQTQVDTVIEYYMRFIEKMPTVQHLADATEDEVFKLWEGLGYYSRARNLLKCARVIASEYRGIFPQDFKLLKSLPGIGPYTAGALMSIAFNQPVSAVDGNVMRVIARHDHILADIGMPRSKKLFEEIVENRIPEDASSFNQALMELGALICLPRNPKCGACPVSRTCIAFEKGIQLELPVKVGKIKKKKEMKAFLLIEADNRILMEKNQDSGLLSGLWTLPMMSLKEPVAIDSQIAEHLLEHYQIEMVKADEINSAKHVFTHKIWEMKLYRITYEQGHLREDENRWFTRDEINELALSKAVKKVMEGI